MDAISYTSEDRSKHLEFIQGVITRLANASFLMKGWALTVAAALYGFAAQHSSWPIAALGWLPVFAFWFLDTYFLWQERLYRELYDAVRSGEGNVAPYSMNANPFKATCSFWDALNSLTLSVFYGLALLVGVVFVVAQILS
jgi:hypothetical protein